MVEPLTHNLKVKGLNPATVTGREKMADKDNKGVTRKGFVCWLSRRQIQMLAVVMV